MTDMTQTAEENLAFIRSVMEKAKKKTTQAGPFLAGWGTASALITGLQYFALKGMFPLHIMPYLWIAFAVIGGIMSGIYGKKLEKTKGTPSLNELITSMLFSCVGITIGIFFAANILAFSLGIKTHMEASETCSTISLVMAIAFFVSSFSTGIKWFRIVAFGWWAALVIFIMKPFGDIDLLLLIAVLDFILIAIPGFKLMALAKSET